MALLRTIHPRWGRDLCALGALGALVSCALLGGRSEATFAFVHRVHVVDEGLECINCHEDGEVEDDPGMPGPGLCTFCHDTIDEDKSAERHVASLFDEEERFRAAHVSRLADEVVFSHLRHVAAGVECGACHAGIEESGRVTAALAVDMARCTDCHAERDQPAECATCHSVIDEGWKPATHERDWERAHGRAFRARGPEPTDGCFLCHTETSCADCHTLRPPDDHTNVFRRRTHGITATLDRDRCAACHQPDSCESCHAEVLPVTHVGNWGGTRSRHCLGCHFPLRANGCVTCHRATPSHALATPKPSWHTPTMNCRQCHGVGQPLPHFDNGSDCNACHR